MILDSEFFLAFDLSTHEEDSYLTWFAELKFICREDENTLSCAVFNTSSIEFF